MEHLNLQLTCTVTVMAGYLGYEQYYRRFARRVPSTTAPLSCTDH